MAKSAAVPSPDFGKSENGATTACRLPRSSVSVFALGSTLPPIKRSAASSIVMASTSSSLGSQWNPSTRPKTGWNRPSSAAMLSERGGASVIRCDPLRSARASTAFSRRMSVKLRVKEIHVMRVVRLLTAASTSKRSWQMETHGGSGPLKSPFCDPSNMNLCSLCVSIFVLVILCTGNRVFGILRVPGFFQPFPVFFDDLHHRRVDVPEPPAWRHEQPLVPEADAPFVRPAHDH